AGWSTLDHYPDEIRAGLPCSAITWSSTRVTRRLGKAVSTSGAKHAREQPSTTLKLRNFRPVANTSCTKSMPHSWVDYLDRLQCLISHSRPSFPRPSFHSQPRRVVNAKHSL